MRRLISATTPAAGRGGRSKLIGAALVLGALVLALVAQPIAEAEPPEVTASENPVLIAYPHFTTKQITLTWNLAGGPPAASLIVEEGGTVVHNQPVTGTGSAPLTVAYGKTYSAKLAAPIIGDVSEPITITTAKPHIEMSCAQRCIESIDVVPHGGWAQFTIKTSETALITVEASTTPPNPNGTWNNPDDVAAFAGSVLPTDSYPPPLANLQANTTYHYVVRARVEGGHEQVKTGTFKTLTRFVDVHFSEIQMIDDSDGPVDGDCDCWFWFGVGEETPKLWGQYGIPQSVASDTTVHPNIVFAVANAPAEVRLGTVGHDDDTDPLELFCYYDDSLDIPEHPPSDWKENFDGGCVEFAGNQVIESLSRQGPPWAPGDVDEEFTDSFTINVNGILAFNVRGTYKVTYE